MDSGVTHAAICPNASSSPGEAFVFRAVFGAELPGTDGIELYIRSSWKGSRMGEVVSIHVVRSRGGAAEPVDRVMVQTNYGLAGDWRSRRNGAGQVTLIEAEALEEVARRTGHPVQSGASRRQIVVQGMRLTDLLWQRISVGAVHLFVEDRCDPCKRMEATIGVGARQAMEGQGGVRCLVLQGGELCIGDMVRAEPFAQPTPRPV